MHPFRIADRRCAGIIGEITDPTHRTDPFAFLEAAGPCPPPLAAPVLALDQWQRWHTAQRVPAEEYLRRCPALADDPEAVLEVIYGEFLVRQALGEEPAAAEYLERFPRFAAALREQFQLFQALERQEPAAGTQAQPPERAAAARAASLATPRGVVIPGYEVRGEGQGWALGPPSLMMPAGINAQGGSASGSRERQRCGG